MPQNPGIPRATDWPLAELESVAMCPVCAGVARELLHEGLTDRVFGCAPGLWRLVACKSCTCAYLDPRPTPSSIGKAYGTYFTHEALLQGVPRMGTLAWWRRATANAYRNFAFGTAFRPSVGSLGVVITKCMPNRRLALESEAAGLLGARPASPGQSLLLDVGCGNGLALVRARSAGWRALGVEPDPVAADAARAWGVEIVAPRIDMVDAGWHRRIERITLSHVIEHVHEPMSLLRHCRRLLKPGGTLWLETPNLGAMGHEWFGSNWRGLEPPRHLVLFREKPLRDLLMQAGFRQIVVRTPRRVEPVTFLASVQIESGRVGASDGRQSLSRDQKRRLARLLREAAAVLQTNSTQSEFLTMEATA